MAAEDGAAMRAAAAEATIALAPWVGNPETTAHYFPPINREPFDVKRARDRWLINVQHGLRALPWAKNPSGDPRKMTAGLRDAAFSIDALVRTAMLFHGPEALLIKHDGAAADWLVKRQHASGVFPFPVGPWLNPREKVGVIVAGIIKKHPEIIVNGWIADDRDDGGLQFDNGLCGRALLSA